MNMRSLLSIIIFTVCITSVAFAHGPSDILLTFDHDTSRLTVKVEHNVSKVNNHYIENVQVKLNGDEIITQQFGSQSSSESQDVQYTIIDARDGDKISVTADCNIIGKKTVEITVSQASSAEEE